MQLLHVMSVLGFAFAVFFTAFFFFAGMVVTSLNIFVSSFGNYKTYSSS